MSKPGEICLKGKYRQKPKPIRGLCVFRKSRSDGSEVMKKDGPKEGSPSETGLEKPGAMKFIATNSGKKRKITKKCLS